MAKSTERVFKASMNAEGLRFGIVCARFNELFTSQLLQGALDIIEQHGAEVAYPTSRLSVDPLQWDGQASEVSTDKAEEALR